MSGNFFFWLQTHLEDNVKKAAVGQNGRNSEEKEQILMNEKYCRRASSPFQGKLQKTGCLWVVQRIHLFMISTRQLNLGGHLKAQKLHDRNTESRKANF